MVITVDGPSGVGKSTVSRSVARALDMAYLDTGSTYRAATLAIIRANVDLNSEKQVLSELSKHTIDYTSAGIQLDGESVADLVRTTDVTAAVSTISAHPLVRTEIVETQRRWVLQHDSNAVVEGRDIGTVVFPDAPVKIYLTATPEVRATRRFGDDEATGKTVEEIATEIGARDEKDSTRAASPLRPADDATILDTSLLSLEQVVDQIVALARQATATEVSGN